MHDCRPSFSSFIPGFVTVQEGVWRYSARIPRVDGVGADRYPGPGARTTATEVMALVQGLLAMAMPAHRFLPLRNPTFVYCYLESILISFSSGHIWCAYGLRNATSRAASDPFLLGKQEAARI
jgi:hypothetical protein